jgi:site-specific DNA recombinase
MDRPALQRLLADLTAGRVDTIVVYKIDRLSRGVTAAWCLNLQVRRR